jgi:hypothetical protein
VVVVISWIGVGRIISAARIYTGVNGYWFFEIGSRERSEMSCLIGEEIWGHSKGSQGPDVQGKEGKEIRIGNGIGLEEDACRSIITHLLRDKPERERGEFVRGHKKQKN